MLGGHLLCASSLPGALPCTPARGSGREVLASACLQAKNPGSEEVSAALESGPEARGLWFLSRVHSLVYCFMLWFLTSDLERSSGNFGERNPRKVRGRGGQHLPKETGVACRWGSCCEPSRQREEQEGRLRGGGFPCARETQRGDCGLSGEAGAGVGSWPGLRAGMGSWVGLRGQRGLLGWSEGLTGLLGWSEGLVWVLGWSEGPAWGPGWSEGLVWVLG